MGGIAISYGMQAAELLGISAIQVSAGGDASPLSSAFALGSWRPPQWNSIASAAIYCITVPGAYTSTVGISTADNLVGTSPTETIDGVATYRQNVTANTVTNPQPPTYLVFDGVMRASHTQTARPTEFAVQSTGNISDHVDLMPARLSLDIIMSDAQQAYALGQWVGASTKSVSCFAVLDALRAARVPLTVSTRLKRYTNMILTDVVPEESARTRYGLRARVEFQQIFVATVTNSTGNSARSQTTDSTTVGPTNTTSVPSGVTTQNSVDAASAEEQEGYTVNGAGNWSSNNTADLGLES